MLSNSNESARLTHLKLKAHRITTQIADIKNTIARSSVFPDFITMPVEGVRSLTLTITLIMLSNRLDRTKMKIHELTHSDNNEAGPEHNISSPRP